MKIGAHLCLPVSEENSAGETRAHVSTSAPSPFADKARSQNFVDISALDLPHSSQNMRALRRDDANAPATITVMSHLWLVKTQSEAGSLPANAAPGNFICPPRLESLSEAFHQLTAEQRAWIFSDNATLACRLRSLLALLLILDKQADCELWERYEAQAEIAIIFLAKHCLHDVSPTSEVAKRFVYLTLSPSENAWVRQSEDPDAVRIRRLFNTPAQRGLIETVYDAVTSGKANAESLLSTHLQSMPR